MRTLMALNGPGVRAGQKLADVRIIDFAPTLARLLGIANPKNATGRVLNNALAAPVTGTPAPDQMLNTSTQESR